MGRAGHGGDLGGTADIEDHLGQGEGLRCQHREAILPEKVVQTFLPKFKVAAFGKAAAGKVNFVGLFPSGVNGDIVGNGVKNRQIFRGIEVHTLEGDFRYDDLPVFRGGIDDLHLIPDFEKLEELFVVALDFSLLPFVEEEHIFINSLVIFQGVP